MSKILVTGATGNIGSSVVQALSAKGVDFAAFVRNPEKAEKLRQEGVEVMMGDFTDIASLQKALSGVDKVFLVAPPVENMSDLEKQVIDACKSTGVRHIVKVSAIGASAEAPVKLGRHHAAVEQYLKDSGIGYTILQPHSFMQNILGSLATIHSQGTIYGSMGDGTYPPVDTRDIGAIAGQILIDEGHEGKTYPITGPEKISYHDIARIIGEAIGKEVNYVALDNESMRQALYGAGMPHWLADDLIQLNEFWKNGMGTKVYDTTEKILGRKGKSFKAFVADHLFLFKGE